VRVLVVAPFPVRMDGRHGGSRAVGQMLATLAARQTVALVVLKGEGEAGVDDGLRELCDLVEEVGIPAVGTSIVSRLIDRIRLRAGLLRGIPTWAAVRGAPGFRERLEQIAQEWRPDVVQLEYRITGRFLPLRGCAAPVVLVEHDSAGPVDVESALLRKMEDRAWRSLGRAAFGSADAVVVFTGRDGSAVSSLSRSARVVRIPLGYELHDPAANPIGNDPHGVLFVASFLHPPNVDAALWLAHDIFPSVRARVPTATLQLVGSQVTDEIRALARPGVAIRPDVAEVWPFLDAAAVVVAPIRLGGGMRVKVLEALAAGKALVATPLAVEGLELGDGEPALVVESALAFADAVVELLTDVARRRRMAESARRWAERNLDVESQVAAYEALYESLLGSTA
jgi:glycosyltransferase involved in cell wall biosynthesis